MATSSQSLVRRLTARVVIVNVFIYLLAGLALYQNRQQYEKQAELSTQNLVQSLEINVSGVLDKISLGLAAVTNEAQRQLADGSIKRGALSAYIQRQQAQIPEIDAIRLTDSAGDVHYGADLPAGPATNIADREYFQRAQTSLAGETIISKPLVSRQNGRWVIVLAQAVRRPDGSFAGMVSGVLPLDYFTHLLSTLDVGPNGLISIRDEDMALIARKPEYEDPDKSVGSRVVSAQTLKYLMTHPDAGSYETVVSVDGVLRRIAFRRTPHRPFYIFVGEASRDYLAPWFKEVWVLSSLVALFTLISAISAWASNRRRQAELLAIEELRNSKEQVQRSETKYRTLYDSTGDAVMLRGKDAFVDCNQAALDMFGLKTREDFAHVRLGGAISPPTQPCGTDSQVLADQKIAAVKEKGSLRFEWVHRRVDNGKLFPAEVLLTRMTLDGEPVIQAVLRDITERKQAEEQIRYLAYFDALTKLPNRRLLMDRLGHALTASRRTRQYGVVMMLDLDNFKSLNDTRGHDVGDQLLIDVAQRIVHCLRLEDTVSRLGGDEYVVMAENLGTDESTAAAQAKSIAEKILHALAQAGSVPVTGDRHHSTVSIGVTLFRGESTSIEALLKQADLALYQAKGAGRNTTRFFSPEMQSTMDARAAMEAALRDGLRRGEFRLCYQPQVDRDAHLTGAEALLRWTPTGGRPIAPAEFIPLAEDTGLIIPIGLWVLQTACDQLATWAKNPISSARKIAVNVSFRQFRQPDFTAQVRQCLERSGANPALLKLELTESVVLEDLEEVIERMRQIKALGVTFSLDDFGTGFSSLSCLKRLPLDQVKIDQSFVRDVVSDPNDGAIVRAIIAMSHSLGIEVIAEGVETEEQLAFLRKSGCWHYQGYLFGKPTPIEEWTKFHWEAPLLVP